MDLVPGIVQRIAGIAVDEDGWFLENVGCRPSLPPWVGQGVFLDVVNHRLPRVGLEVTAGVVAALVIDQVVTMPAGSSVTLVTLWRFQAAKHGFLRVTGRVTAITLVTTVTLFGMTGTPEDGKFGRQ